MEVGRLSILGEILPEGLKMFVLPDTTSFKFSVYLQSL